MRNKASAAQMDMFLETVIEMIVKGMSRTDILRYFTENENPELQRKESSVDLYLKKARKEIKKRYSPQREELLADSLAKLDNLYKKSYTIQDYRECRNVLETRARLTGIEISKIDITSKGKELPATVAEVRIIKATLKL